MDFDPTQLKALLELLQGGGTAGLVVFGFLMLRSFKDLRDEIKSLNEKIDRNNEARGKEFARVRERLIRIEVELEHVSKRTGGNFRIGDADNGENDT